MLREIDLKKRKVQLDGMTTNGHLDQDVMRYEQEQLMMRLTEKLPSKKSKALKLYLDGYTVSELVGDTLPAIPNYVFPVDTFYLSQGDTVDLTPPIQVGNFTFIKWLCLTDPAINNTSTVPLLITRPASNLKDFVLSAVYGRTPIDTLGILADSGGTAFVRNVDFSDLECDSVTSGDSLYFIRRGKVVILIPNPDSGYEFSHWFSTDPKWNGNTGKALVLPIESTANFTPVFNLRAAGL